ncbi:hypothetical protein DXG01_006530 [Tephrocybe rancida]|nr:hypothetical protein DXG01_006530 [Tephrocybe rancida]
MKLISAITLSFAAIAVNAAAPQGIDVSSYQPSINWATVKANGIKFVFIKATEGTSRRSFSRTGYLADKDTGYTNPSFSSQYTGATNNGLIRGGYHFARPDVSSGATQANYFLAHGGGWSADGITLPGALDIEYNPYGATCYGLSAASMVAWIKDFSNTYLAKTGRYPSSLKIFKNVRLPMLTFEQSSTPPLIGGPPARATTLDSVLPTLSGSPDTPLLLALSPLAGRNFTTFWQYADSGPNPGDQDLFNGDAAGLGRMAKGS